MSIRQEGQKIETLYVGVQPRKVPAPGELKPHGSVYNITSDQIEIFGAPILTLVIGNTYRFIIDAPGHPFYITTDSTGGGATRNPSMSLTGAIEIPIEERNSKGNVGIEKGNLVWTPRKDHMEMKLFYQCNFHKHMGNIINVIEPANSK